MRNILTGTTIKGLTQGNFYKFTFEAPDVPTQKKIVEVLESIDAVIDKTREVVEKYRNLKKGILEDFVSKGSDGKPETLITGSPVIAKGWGFKPLSQLTLKIADRDHTTPIYVQNGVPIVSPKDFDEDEYIDFTNCVMISEKAHQINRKRTDITAGDLIFTRIGAGLGKICLVTEDMPEFSILHSAAMIRTAPSLKNRYFLHLVRSYYFQKQISMGIQSIGVPDLGMDKMNDLLVLYPKDINVQEEIANTLDAIESKIRNEKEYLQKLKNTKNGLLHQMLTGIVDVNVLKI
jgi:type I restriction enzyme S subunit